MLYPDITRKQLENLYVEKGMSMMEISKRLGCSHHKVAYWMHEYKINRRSISQAIYLRSNPDGDPFRIKTPETRDELMLFGLGMGLYWGEGTKSNKNSVRLGNTDPEVIKSFISFLVLLCGVDKARLKFGLQIFSDISADSAIKYWLVQLRVDRSQIYKPVVTKSGSLGNYRNKNEYGVVTIYFGNTKLRDILVRQVAEIAQMVEHFNGNEKVTGSIPVLGSTNSMTIP